MIHAYFIAFVGWRHPGGLPRAELVQSPLWDKALDIAKENEGRIQGTSVRMFAPTFPHNAALSLFPVYVHLPANSARRLCAKKNIPLFF